MFGVGQRRYGVHRLPDSGARTRLILLQQQRTKLPLVLLGDTVKDPMELLVYGHDEPPLPELLGRFESLGIESVIPTVVENESQ